MGKMKCLLYFISYTFYGFTVTNDSVVAQYHADEKRNVKQPPHPMVIKNLTTGFYNLMITLPIMS